METIKKEFAKEHILRRSTSKIQNTYVWPMLKSEENFYKVAEEAGLSLDDNYRFIEDGIYLYDDELLKLSSHLMEKYDISDDPYDYFDKPTIPEKDCVLSFKEIVGWCIKKGYLFVNEQGEYQPTNLGIKEGLLTMEQRP